MNLRDLQVQIKDNQLDDIYVFLGSEKEIQDLYINKMAQISKLTVKYCEFYKDIVKDIASNNLFGLKRVFVVLYDDDILKHEEVWNKIDTNGNIIIFKYVELDKRSKFYKNFENKIVEFNKLSDEVLTLHIKKLTALNDINCKTLIDICENSYDRIILELDKINNYDWDNTIQITPDIAFTELEGQNAFYTESEDVTFEFIDAIVTRDIYKLKSTYKLINCNDINILGLLSLLYNNLKTILLIQSCVSNDIAGTTGLSSQQIYYNKPKIGSYKIQDLVYALKTIYKLDKDIKNGNIDEKFTIDYLIVNLVY